MGGCFLACFGSKEDDRKRRSRRYNKLVPRHLRHGSPKTLQPTLSLEQEGPAEAAEVAKQISEVLDEPEEQLSCSTRKKVTFDTNVKIYEPVPVYESIEVLPKSNEDDGENQVEEVSGESKDDSVASSVGSYPPNHRYQNCRDSDDELDESEFEDSDLDDDDDDEGYGDYDEIDNEIIVGQEVWSEAIPTSSMESTTEASSAAMFTEEVESHPIKSVSVDNDEEKFGSKRSARDRSVYVHPVLNPVENLAQWKAVKSRGKPPSKPQKENSWVDLEVRPEPEFNFRSKPYQSKPQSEEISVDASLSNWLGSSETSATQKSSFCGGLETYVTSEPRVSNGSYSVMSIEDRPILGALTVEELKQHSTSSSPRKSPCRSPDDMPILGTVGTYWSHKEPAMDSGPSPTYKGMPNTRSNYRGVYVK